MGRNRVALGEVWLTITQGSAFLATLGFGTQPDRTDSIPNVFFIPFAFVCKQSQRDCVLQPKVARNEKMPNAERRLKPEFRRPSLALFVRPSGFALRISRLGAGRRQAKRFSIRAKCFQGSAQLGEANPNPDESSPVLLSGQKTKGDLARNGGGRQQRADGRKLSCKVN